MIDRLSADLRAAFPDMKGFSTRNLHYMRLFAEECPSGRILQQSAAELPWFHIVTILTRLSDPTIREWYAREALAGAWPRDTLSGRSLVWWGLQEQVRTFCFAPEPAVRGQMDDFKLMISGTALDAAAITSALEEGLDAAVLAPDVVVPRVRCAAGDRART